jgi:hypothetical protein
MDPQASPFAVLSLIVAPAILTNASSVLAMSTTTRLARAVDRARDLATQIEGREVTTAVDIPVDEEFTRLMNELTATERRAVMLTEVLQSFYVALGGFATATLLSLVGAVLINFTTGHAITVVEIVAVATGVIAVGALVRGSVILVHETAIGLQIMHDRAQRIRARLHGAGGR